MISNFSEHLEGICIGNYDDTSDKCKQCVVYNLCEKIIKKQGKRKYKKKEKVMEKKEKKIKQDKEVKKPLFRAGSKSQKFLDIYLKGKVSIKDAAKEVGLNLGAAYRVYNKFMMEMER